MAEWLNYTFRGFDNGVFNAMHSLAENAGGFFTPFFKAVSVIGEKGIIFFIAAMILMLFSNTRKKGVCMFGALAIAAFVTSVILKNAVARVRPYAASEEYFAFWEYVKGTVSDSYCFPSGHTTMIMAAMTAMFICFNKKWSFVGFFAVVVMGFARVYLFAHYATDVIGGIIVGDLAAVLAFFITKYIFLLLEKHKDKKFCAFCLNFDFMSLLNKPSLKKDDDESNIS